MQPHTHPSEKHPKALGLKVGGTKDQLKARGNYRFTLTSWDPLAKDTKGVASVLVVANAAPKSLSSSCGVCAERSSSFDVSTARSAVLSRHQPNAVAPRSAEMRTRRRRRGAASPSPTRW